MLRHDRHLGISSLVCEFESDLSHCTFLQLQSLTVSAQVRSSYGRLSNLSYDLARFKLVLRVHIQVDIDSYVVVESRVLVWVPPLRGGFGLQRVSV